MTKNPSESQVFAEIFTGQTRLRHFRFSQAMGRMLGAKQVRIVGRPEGEITSSYLVHVPKL